MNKKEKNEENKKGNGKVIFNYVPISRTMTLTIEEFRALIDYYDYGHPHRLCFLLMGCYGLRTCEVVNIKIPDFSDECRILNYKIGKYAKVKMYHTGTRSETRKLRSVKIFDSLRKELIFYIENNYHMFKNREIFRFNKDSLRRYLGKLRKKAKQGKIDNPVLEKLLLDTEGARYAFGMNVQPAYRFSLHSFRRFFITYFYNVVSDKDLVYTQLEIGHSVKDTTMLYIKKAENIGITPEMSKKELDFESMFYERTQTNLLEFAQND